MHNTDANLVRGPGLEPGLSFPTPAPEAGGFANSPSRALLPKPVLQNLVLQKCWCAVMELNHPCPSGRLIYGQLPYRSANDALPLQKQKSPEL